MAAFIQSRTLTTREKGRIAEAAILLRLTLLGVEVWKEPFDGSRTDFIVVNQDGKTVKIAVRWIRETKSGRKIIGLANSNKENPNKLPAKHSDLLIGYHLQTDTAFVIPQKGWVKKSREVTCKTEYEEAWHYLLETGM